MDFYKVTQTEIPPNPKKNRDESLYLVVLLGVAGDHEEKAELFCEADVYAQAKRIPRFAPVELTTDAVLKYGRLQTEVVAIRPLQQSKAA